MCQNCRSCAGQRVSIGQYFERKSKNIGALGNDDKARPNFSFNTETPIRTDNPRLIESTIISDGNNLKLY